ncbi:MAG: hypothetical protein PHV59_13050, partial [Victivallales bacterium]|nr:hypothetical protein [Victivallales bacterium]
YHLFTGKLMGYIVSVKLWDVAACIALLERSPFIVRGKNRRKLDSRVDNTIYALDRDSMPRWQLRGYALAAGSDEIIDFILANSNLPEL